VNLTLAQMIAEWERFYNTTATPAQRAYLAQCHADGTAPDYAKLQRMGKTTEEVE